jgi:lytic murein transglycosylase
MDRYGKLFGAGCAFAAALFAATCAMAATDCRTSGSFEAWLARFKAEAAAQGISRGAIDAAAPYLVYDQRIVNIDRGQRIFAQSFIEFSGKMLPAYRLQQGSAEIKKYAAIFDRADKQYGVQAAVITAFWGLESDFGTNMGKDHAIRSLTTLAYDCRRAEMFRGHLFDALRLIERGDLVPADMLGSWAGELGQTQMMPSEYIKYAVDYDGDGKRNLLRSVPDVIGSTANYLVSLGWKRGEPWLQEVRVPANLPWDQADLTIQHTRGEWAAWGVTQATAGRRRTTGSRPRCSCRWGGSARPSSPSTISRRISNGTHRLSIRPPPPITRRALQAARQWSAAAAPRPPSRSNRPANCSSF